MTISKSKFFLLLAMAMAVPAILLTLFMDVPFGMKAEGLESGAGAPIAAAHDEGTPASCDVAISEEGHYSEHEAGGGHSEGGSNSATNSGEITDAQFNDGGFGDIGQQWWNVNVNGPVINVHISGNDNTSVVTVGEEILEGEGTSLGTTTPQEEPAPTTTVAPTTTTAAPTTTTIP